MLSPNQHQQLAAAATTIVDLNAAYQQMRLIKSTEEIQWLRLGAALTDLAITALAEAARPGLSERELGDIVERSYLPLGGTNAIDYFAVTPMDDPSVAVPAQFPSTRRLCQGDILVTEISAQFWEYSGQVLRSFAVDAEPAHRFVSCMQSRMPLSTRSSRASNPEPGSTTCVRPRSLSKRRDLQ